MAATLELKPIPTGDPEAKTTTAEPAAPSIDQMVQGAIDSGKDAAYLTKLYLRLRGGKKDLEEKAKSKIAPINKGLELIETHFLKLMLEMGVDSLKNEAGTPYKTTKTSITVADNEVWLDFVLTRALSALPLKPEMLAKVKQAMIESGQFALIESRASKSAVEALMEETQELPPGLNHRAETAVNVKAS